MKKVLLILGVVLLSSCASSDEAKECFDTNGDGLINSNDTCYNA